MRFERGKKPAFERVTFSDSMDPEESAENTDIEESPAGHGDEDEFDGTVLPHLSDKLVDSERLNQVAASN